MLAIAAVAASVALSLAGCSSAVPLDAADDAKNVACAAIVVALPDTVASQEKRETTSQGTGAWGDPTSVTLRCGVAIPGPSTLPCVLVGSVYWIRDDANAPDYRFTTYGREPAVQVVVDQDVVSPGVALYDLESAVRATTVTGQCTEIEDELQGDGSAATPAPTSDPTATSAPTPTVTATTEP
jgi:hypothetical protein